MRSGRRFALLSTSCIRTSAPSQEICEEMPAVPSCVAQWASSTWRTCPSWGSGRWSGMRGPAPPAASAWRAFRGRRRAWCLARPRTTSSSPSRA
ncbi:unnamed protein product [Effrenium voratum]|uniref:Uncharacterized protein n=1 Tax=Effrenium voratum TaxID=2562239 RepID=A0AA36I4L2_9DINO|nr:unnamed protein product [Effrenium voratum]